MSTAKSEALCCSSVSMEATPLRTRSRWCAMAVEDEPEVAGPEEDPGTSGRDDREATSVSDVTELSAK